MLPTRRILGSIRTLKTPWRGPGPFLYINHHVDAYPRGQANLGPDPALLAGRDIGNDFGHASGWNMYFGRNVPGFGSHPHRGFETITIVRRGYIDHADSSGAGARYGPGDVQWITTGRGVLHSEMFPLLNKDVEANEAAGDSANAFEIYQIWLNLARRDKAARPEFSMMWREHIPCVASVSSSGARANARIVAGTWGSKRALSPPRASWAAKKDAGVAIYDIDLDPHAHITLPPVSAKDRHNGTQQMLFVHGPKGCGVDISGTVVAANEAYIASANDPAQLTITAGDERATVLVTQSTDIGEPVAVKGPFVMNTDAEVAQAYADYKNKDVRDQKYGAWRWDAIQPTYPADQTRFAKFADGRVEYPEGNENDDPWGQ